MAKTKFPNQIIRKDGKNCFVELLGSAYGIDKLVLNFVNYDKNQSSGNRTQGEIAIYLDMFQGARIAQCVLDGQFDSLADIRRTEAKKSGSNYPQPVLAPILSGTPAKNSGTGNTISRQISLSPGASKPWVLEAKQGLGRVLDTGLIAPDYKTPDILVRIPLSNDDLTEIALAIQYAVQVWMTAKFTPIVAEPLRIARERVIEEMKSHSKSS